MDVLRMLVQDRLASLLKNTDAITSLVRLYNQVKQHGICVVSYAEWFLEGHPEWTKPVAFGQEQAETFSLIGELAVVASVFYKSTAAFRSHSFSDAAQQMGGAEVEALWTALIRPEITTAEELLIDTW
ncbi:hypothetical protein LTR16_003356, partial [Cryomyces antarcticus]